MQISLRCKHCGYIYLNDKDEDLAMEIDFVEEEIRYICRKCKRDNRMVLGSKARRDQPLPSIVVTRGA